MEYTNEAYPRSKSEAGEEPVVEKDGKQQSRPPIKTILGGVVVIVLLFAAVGWWSDRDARAERERMEALSKLEVGTSTEAELVMMLSQLEVGTTTQEERLNLLNNLKQN